MHRRSVLAAAALAAAFALPAAAQDFPTRQVRLLTPFPAGAGPEGILRVLAEKLGKKWNQPVIVENKPGANGFIAIDTWKRGDTAGYDILQLDNVHLAAYPHLFKKLPYDTAKDFDLLVPLFRTHFFGESGGPAGYEVTGWTTRAVPKGLPKATLDKIQKDVETALAEPEMKARFDTFGYHAFPATREQFTALISSESAKYGEVVKKTKASLD